MNAFSRVLSELRAARAWTQKQLAMRAGVDPSSVSRYEAGERDPERETVVALADAMALPMVDRERLLAAAGFRSEAWDDPLLVELVQLLADPALPSEAAAEVRTLVRVAVHHGRHARDGQGRGLRTEN